MVFNSHVFQFVEQGFHGREYSSVVCTAAEDDSFVAEDVVDDVGWVGFGCVVDPDFFDSFFCEEASDCVCHLFGVSVHADECDE